MLCGACAAVCGALVRRSITANTVLLGLSPVNNGCTLIASERIAYHALHMTALQLQDKNPRSLRTGMEVWKFANRKFTPFMCWRPRGT
jgi:hypothetical protein